MAAFSIDTQVYCTCMSLLTLNLYTLYSNGVKQGRVIFPILSNIYMDEVKIA